MFRPEQEINLDMTPTDFEKFALLILKQQINELPECLFEHNKIMEVSDGNYQIDGYIEFTLMGVKYKTLVECKHYKRSIEREKVQVLYDKLRACGAQKGILVSTSSFQAGAITYATSHGIALIQITEEGIRYENRSRFNHSVAEQGNVYSKNFGYIGIMQTSRKEGIIQCSYLDKMNLSLKSFLELD